MRRWRAGGTGLKGGSVGERWDLRGLRLRRVFRDGGVQEHVRKPGAMCCCRVRLYVNHEYTALLILIMKPAEVFGARLSACGSRAIRGGGERDRGRQMPRHLGGGSKICLGDIFVSGN